MLARVMFDELSNRHASRWDRGTNGIGANQDLLGQAMCNNVSKCEPTWTPARARLAGGAAGPVLGA
jgi:hypothetical protein